MIDCHLSCRSLCWFCGHSWTDEMATPEDGRGEPTIVAMGASAGGVQALQTFFRQLPDRTGAAFVVIVHLDPQHRSELPRILGGRTAMPVVQVEGNQKIEP